MKNQIVMLRIAGSICLLFMLFHFAFQKLFNWNVTLSCLSQSDRAILLTYHYISILILAFMTFVSVFQARLLLASSLKYSALWFFSLFFIIRITTEFTLFGISQHSLIILVMCAIPVVMFSFPLFIKK